ncbi:MAG: NADH-quinone oxidoreductase subunit NuoK [bacterium]|jgi:NADH-quinone oxidoreductase subunit K
MTTSISLSHYLILSAVLFSMGMLGVMLRRNMLIILMSIELMLNAANLAIIAFARYPVIAGNAALGADSLSVANNGMVFVFIVMTVAAAEVGVGLAIVINLFRQRETVNIEAANILEG